MHAMALDMLVVSTVKPAPAPLVHTTDAAADVASDVLVPPMSQVRSQEKVQGTVAHVLLALLANMVSPAVTLLVMLPEMCAWLYTGSICGGGGGAARAAIAFLCLCLAAPPACLPLIAARIRAHALGW